MLLDHYLRADRKDVGAAAAELETLGLDGLYTAEGPHEPFLPLALAAEHTSRATLYTNIAVALARSPMDLAQTANDLQLASCWASGPRSAPTSSIASRCRGATRSSASASWCWR